MKKFLNLIVAAISVATIFSGLAQLLAPQFVLMIVGAEITSTSSHFFAIVGMFMFLFGGLMLQTIYAAIPSSAAIFWCAMQKLGAFAAVSLGVMHGIFSPGAMAVAIFDLVSGIIFLYYMRSVKADAAGY